MIRLRKIAIMSTLSLLTWGQPFHSVSSLDNFQDRPDKTGRLFIRGWHYWFLVVPKEYV